MLIEPCMSYYATCLSAVSIKIGCP
jgi:hypothetical protein